MISDAWKEYAEENELSVDDVKLQKLFEWAWHTAINECTSFLNNAGHIGLSNRIQDYMMDSNWDYEEEE